MADYNIKKRAIKDLGYQFIKPAHLPRGKDEYYLRNLQNNSGIDYRKLTAQEIESLVLNRNSSDDWNNVLVSDAFNPSLVKNCTFLGLVRIGKLEPLALEYSDLRFMVGLYNSTIISCDIGDNVVIENVYYLSHFIIGNEVILINVNELATTDYAKFGNGIIKHGENEDTRIWLELCNENGGRKVIPFSGMLAGDAFLWSKYRDDDKLLSRFKDFAEMTFNNNRGYYGMIGDRSVIKNCLSIKDVWIGSDAYIKGANKLKNLTVHSDRENKTQIGESCELVNGIINKGCRVFYGCKAVRFIMASNSQLKYGARLINSYLGDNSTISCCEVLNSLIFPAHEQHHNNSFLCAALVLGQSNMPAGATIGSNHNSRAADGEIVAGRGFWPGLCVSLKHNSRFASFTMIAKGDYLNELNITIPFSLVSLDESKNLLQIMPAYWFMYNLYALERNSWKYADRDKRTEKQQVLEYEYLAPDSINEIMQSIVLFEKLAGNSITENNSQKLSDDALRMEGRTFLTNDDSIKDLEIADSIFENSKRKTVLFNIKKAYALFKEMVIYYGMSHWLLSAENSQATNLKQIKKILPGHMEEVEWINVGGQLIPANRIEWLKKEIKENRINSWDEVHDFYKSESDQYYFNKLNHSLAMLQKVTAMDLKKITKEQFVQLLDETVNIKKKITEGIIQSRKKDYTNPFRKMVYDNEKEMEKVIGKFSANSFIIQKENELKNFSARVQKLKKSINTKKAITVKV